MFVPVQVYDQKCPTCGQTSSRLVEKSTEVRVGKEVFRCKCGIEHPIGNVEWAHLDPKQRTDYFFGSAEIGSVLICTFMPALFAYFVANGWRWRPRPPHGVSYSDWPWSRCDGQFEW